ncbi:hypothetical protein Y032_0534g3060 [Ancylostoma ceylanicum]|uniref:Uncharacterized protein n=1 Tax=Ancylostoma ceylanicum TaxID=53326 RepID=A0A016WTH3_9BILA|nr:hypothetical protein Y032_0534g3060 [Ancylostoma ceylanicum]
MRRVHQRDEGSLARESGWSSIGPTQPDLCFLKVAPALDCAHFHMIVFLLPTLVLILIYVSIDKHHVL